jgi:hypothetical protein
LFPPAYARETAEKGGDADDHIVSKHPSASELRCR